MDFTLHKEKNKKQISTTDKYHAWKQLLNGLVNKCDALHIDLR